MNARERIQQVAEQWFLTEPVFFAVYCSHRLTMNANMQCPLRTGQGRIEYNPTVIDALQDNQLNEMLKVEMIRILLQHPYARQPLGCKPLVQHAASDMVIAPAYRLAWIELTKPEDFGLPVGQHYEWYAARLNGMAIHLDGLRPSEGDSGGDSGEGTNGYSASGGSSGSQETGKEQGKGKQQAETDYTALWEEDQFQSRLITDLIQSTTGWGSMPGGMIELIKKAAEGKIDFRSALRGFRASILSQKRRLTRMRPSRRFGFEQMGSHYDFTTHLLVAIDTSGSVGSEELGRYFHIITSFFKYGIQEIDVIMFDVDVQGKPVTLKEAKKNMKDFEVQGRGGTNFQAPIDYVKEHPDYDGLIIITDGWAPMPDVPPHLKAKLLWVIDNEASYQQNGKALRKTGRVCLM
jgi:predicted metal-dependent peptidase